MVELVEQRQRVGAGGRIDLIWKTTWLSSLAQTALSVLLPTSRRKRDRVPATSAGLCCLGCPCPQPGRKCIDAKSTVAADAGEELENAGDVDRVVVAGRIGVADTLRQGRRNIVLVDADRIVRADGRQQILLRVIGPSMRVNWIGGKSSGPSSGSGSGPSSGSTLALAKFAPDARAPVPSPAAGSTDWSVVIGNVDANSAPENSLPFDSIVMLASGTPIESKNGMMVTVDWLSNRMISRSPMWTSVIFSFAIARKNRS